MNQSNQVLGIRCSICGLLWISAETVETEDPIMPGDLIECLCGSTYEATSDGVLLIEAKRMN